MSDSETTVAGAKEALFAAVDDERERMAELATRIWETPELGLHEEESARVLREALESAGFDVASGVGDMPTAFVAECGEGAPRIGILGEYDALPGLSQRVAAERDPVEPGEPGHGCGHNLFGTAGVGAAVALKRAVDRGDLDGTVRFYGCPAEETLVGKVFMARDGAFDDLDAAVTWHPGDLTQPQLGSALALDSVRFRFEGTSAHAAASPESGRSALDAVQLLNTGAEFVREHVSDDARIHYNIVEGGDAPNVVPAEAEVWYFVRAPTRGEVDRIADWLSDVAEGAALMTQTSVTERYVTGCHDLLSNRTIAGAMRENMDAAAPITYDDADREFAADLKETVAHESVESTLEDVPEDRREAARDAALFAEPLDATDEGETGFGSTDVGDVSYVAPTAQFRAATWALGTPAHTWQAVAANGSFGRKALPFVAKVLAGTAYDLATDDALLDDAQAEFEEATGDEPYESPLPSDLEPPFDITS